jgi:hypothetical protein
MTCKFAIFLSFFKLFVDFLNDSILVLGILFLLNQLSFSNVVQILQVEESSSISGWKAASLRANFCQEHGDSHNANPQKELSSM